MSVKATRIYKYDGQNTEIVFLKQFHSRNTEQTRIF